MSLIGPFIIGGSSYLFENLQIPCEISLGTVPRMQFFEELKCIVKNPAPIGTTFKVIDEYNNEIIKKGKIYPDRQGIYTVTNILYTDENTEKKLHGIFEGPSGTISIFFIKKLWRITNE